MGAFGQYFLAIGLMIASVHPCEQELSRAREQVFDQAGVSFDSASSASNFQVEVLYPVSDGFKKFSMKPGDSKIHGVQGLPALRSCIGSWYARHSQGWKYRQERYIRYLHLECMQPFYHECFLYFA